MSRNLICVNVALFFLTVPFCGCVRRSSKIDPFLDQYQAVASKYSVDQSASEKRYTFSVSDMTMSDFAIYFSDLTNYGIIYSESIDQKTITAELKDSTPSEFMSYIARRFDVSLVRSGTTFFLGKTTNLDKGFFVRKVRGFSKDDLKSAFSTLFADSGRCHITDSGIVVFCDLSPVLVRAVELADRLEKQVPDTWCVQFFILSRTYDSGFSFGSDFVVSGDLSVFLHRLSGKMTSSNIKAMLAPVLSGKSQFGQLVCSPMVLLNDGVTAKWSDGNTTPIPNKTVSSEGTVTTSGYTNVNSGLSISCTFRECSGGAILDFTLEDSSIISYVENAPQLVKTGLNTSLYVESSKYYLLGEYKRSRSSGGLSSLFVRKNESLESSMYVFCRVYRIGHDSVDYQKIIE